MHSEEPQENQIAIDARRRLRAAVRRYEKACFPAPAATLGSNGWVVEPGRPLTGGDPEHSPEAVDEMQAAMLDALQTGEPLPGEMRRHLTLAFEYLQAGISHVLLTPVRRPGGREAPILKHLQIDALRYLQWCEEGKIADPRPLSTVGTAYRVATKTAGNWKRNWVESTLPEVPAHFDAAQVYEALQQAGAAYQRFRTKARP